MRIFGCIVGMLITLPLCLLFLLLMVVGGTNVYALSYPQEWQTVEGKLLSLRLTRQDRGYEAEINTLYVIDGEDYRDSTEERIRGEAGTSADKAKQDVERRLGLGNVLWSDQKDGAYHRAVLNDNNSRIRVSYHPKIPLNAYYDGFHREIAERRVSLNMKVVMLFGALLMGASLGFFFSLRGLFRKNVKPSDENLFADEKSA